MKKILQYLDHERVVMIAISVVIIIFAILLAL